MSQHALRRVGLLPGDLLQGVSALGGVCSKGGFCSGGVSSGRRGVSAPGGGIPAWTEADTPPPREQNHTRL